MILCHFTNPTTGLDISLKNGNAKMPLVGRFQFMKGIMSNGKGMMALNVSEEGH